MNLIEKAIIVATKAHQHQKRKGTDIPYITHPFAVGMLLQQAKCSEEVIAAGILHDTLEDTEVTYENLVESFGEGVANLVRAASEQDKSLPWEERKQHTIDMLESTSIEEVQVIVADKLHNLRSIHHDLDANGDMIWQRFKHGKNAQHWYYASIVKVLSPRKEEFELINQLEQEVNAVFGSIYYNK
ncbi:GTP pyrophosphokinase [Gracilibacillus boraciitolerans JCM 21714]|uniref:GTP pyrophosphokinase n=1 Tax=Gracilibacillus boraciitolerans JCM 21714 TaxID=1298598 RepID=W4VCE3_9BACI|nr:HD domain-containing protein [Gracilibacillus boraciitolerans]GAE91090.1 GTP pyrophosphokinase [Gracilibacillus boraciitolerans JCM 21714]